MKFWIAAGALSLALAGGSWAVNWITADAPRLNDRGLKFYAAETRRISDTAVHRDDYYSARRALAAVLNYAEMFDEAHPSRLARPTRSELTSAWARMEGRARTDTERLALDKFRERYETALANAPER